MFAIIGITGNVGSIVARTLLVLNQSVRGIVRDVEKGVDWAKKGCDIAVADLNDANALKKAFQGVEGVFVMLPPNFAPSKNFPEARSIITALYNALNEVRPGKVVCLSTIGAQVTRPNLLNQLHIMEEELGRLPMPIAFIRAGWFMENSSWDVTSAKERGIIKSFLQPLDRPIPMVATTDIGVIAAKLLREPWLGRRIIELEGQRRVTPNDIAASFSEVLGRPVRMEVVPRDQWEGIFKSQGILDPSPRIQMLDGFNEGWIKFENDDATTKGETSLVTVLKRLVNPDGYQPEKEKPKSVIEDTGALASNATVPSVKVTDNQYLGGTVRQVAKEQREKESSEDANRVASTDPSAPSVSNLIP